VSVRVNRSDQQTVVETDTYGLELDPLEPRARLVRADGSAPVSLFLLAALDTDRGLDGTVMHHAPTIAETDGGVVLTFEQASTVWQGKRVRVTCRPDDVELVVEVEGSARLTTVRLLGGPYTGNSRWGGGAFHSHWMARTLFDPSPDDPWRITSAATEPATVGVVGGSLPGRGHWFFTPSPFLLAGHPDVDADPQATEGWQTLELRCGVEAATFTEVRYVPFLGGFSIELAYEGQTAVDGTFATPPLVIRPTAGTAYTALAEHADALRAAGLAPRVERRRADWWTRPIFCGWGEQFRHHRLEGGRAVDWSRREHYDRWLETLAAHGVVPGTIVIDDRWQATYGGNQPDEERWPDLRGWIADRHADGQRVLLWFKAWDPQGLPLDACVTDAVGRPIAADPTSPAYQALLQASLHRMLSADGLAADGLKVDFTAQTPSGPGLRRQGDAWGVALLHRLLALVYRFAKEANPDALIVTHTPNPLFADVTDMIRLNDLLRLEDPQPFPPAVAQMTHRARVAASMEPGMLIDTDDWCMPSKAEWRAYLAAKPMLGVPALYYATGIDTTGEEFSDEDYAAIRQAWAAWEARRTQEEGA
jgi:hypothetical protein